MTQKRKTVLAILALFGLGTAIVGYQLWYHLAKKGPAAIYADPEEHFKYGGIGLKQGFPLVLWTVMPEVFSDLLPRPGGWEVFGLIDEGRGHPVGFAEQTVGFPGLSPNCALCHTGQYRTEPSADPVIVPGAPAASLDFEAFNEFVFAAAQDARFDSDVLMPAIEKHFELSRAEKLIYRYVLLPTVGATLRKQAAGNDWLASRPPAGCGRFDAFNLFKIVILKLPDDGSIGTSDYPPLWNQGARQGQYLHWNGSGNDLREDDLMSVYPLNQGPSGFLADSFDQVMAYLHDLPHASFPFPIDREKAERGRLVYDQNCASCHAFGAEKVGQVTAQSEVGTDPEFLGMWSEDFVDALKKIDSPPFRFPGLRRTDGYLNVPLDGCWLRAPYLHNGSVPTLRDLLEPAANRPTAFSRGNDIYDPVAMGFVSDLPPAPGASHYDTSLRGNSNAGHEYGVELPAEAKDDLIEFLKTL